MVVLKWCPFLWTQCLSLRRCRADVEGMVNVTWLSSHSDTYLWTPSIGLIQLRWQVNCCCDSRIVVLHNKHVCLDRSVTGWQGVEQDSEQQWESTGWPGPVFCLLLWVSSDYAQPITGQVTEVTCPVIGRAQHELTPSKGQKTGPDHLVISNVTEWRRAISEMKCICIPPKIYFSDANRVTSGTKILFMCEVTNPQQKWCIAFIVNTYHTNCEIYREFSKPYDYGYDYI